MIAFQVQHLFQLTVNHSLYPGGLEHDAKYYTNLQERARLSVVSLVIWFGCRIRAGK